MRDKAVEVGGSFGLLDREGRREGRRGGGFC
jgi:hypothetical protein